MFDGKCEDHDPGWLDWPAMVDSCELPTQCTRKPNETDIVATPQRTKDYSNITQYKVSNCVYTTESRERKKNACTVRTCVNSIDEDATARVM